MVVPALPDVPTTKEGGLPEYQVSAWNAVFAPKGTPPEVLAKLRDALVKAVTDPATKKKLEDLGGVVPDAQRASPEALAELVRTENVRWVSMLYYAQIAESLVQVSLVLSVMSGLEYFQKHWDVLKRG